jgi:hypothetical protein
VADRDHRGGWPHGELLLLKQHLYRPTRTPSADFLMFLHQELGEQSQNWNIFAGHAPHILGLEDILDFTSTNYHPVDEALRAEITLTLTSPSL